MEGARQEQAAPPLLAGSNRNAAASHSMLPRIGTAKSSILPGTPPALSHYVDLAPQRLSKRQLREPSQGEIERIRLELEARERQEAKYFGYGRRVRPGSRMGLDGRKTPARPPWALSPEVTYALGQMDGKQGLVDRLRMSNMLSKLSNSHLDHGSTRNNIYGRVVPYQLVRKAPLLERFTSNDMPIPDGKTESGCVTMCEFSQAEGLLRDVLRVRKCDVLMGSHIPCYPEKLGPLLEQLRLCLLQGNGIGDRTAAIAEGMLTATKLTHLALCENQVGNEGVARIARSISNTTLTSLDLTCNYISDDGAAAIAASLTKCCCYDIMQTAVEEGHAAVVEAVLLHGYPVNPTYPGEEALLLKAARAGSASICECLLDRDANIEARDARGKSAAMLAAANGHTRVLTFLIDRGADMHARDIEGLTALMLAARFGHVECLQLLIGVAKLLSHKVGVYVRGIRDLEVYPPSDFERVASAASSSGHGSKGSKRSAWGKVRGVALALGTFARASSGSGGALSRTASSKTSYEYESKGEDDSGAVGKVDSYRKESVTPKVIGPGFLRRLSMGSFSGSWARRESMEALERETKEREETIASLKMRAQARASEKLFGRLPSTNSTSSGANFGYFSVEKTSSIAGHHFGHPDAPGDTPSRLPSVSEHGIAEQTIDSSTMDGRPDSQCSSRPSSQSSKRAQLSGKSPLSFLSRRPSLFASADIQQTEQKHEKESDNDAAKLSDNPSKVQQPSKTAAALLRAPTLSKRPSMVMWGAGASDLLLKKISSTAQLPASRETESSDDEGELLQVEGIFHAGAKRNLLGSFLSKKGTNEQATDQDVPDRNTDTVYIRLSMGKLAYRQEFTSPPQEVPCKSGALKTLLMHQFGNITIGMNSRLKLEILFKDPGHPSNDLKSVGLCVEDLDDLISGKVHELDGWFVAHDFVTRRRVGAVLCKIRCMPEQFYGCCYAGDNVLIHAARNGNPDCVRMLLDSGMTESYRSKDGNTALIVAAKGGHRSTVEMLLRHGADITLQNDGGFTAMDMAEKYEHMKIVSLLKGVIMQKEKVPFSLSMWPSDHVDDADPIAFLKDRFRGSYKDSELVLEVVGARNLPKADVSGLSDPFVKINLNGMKHSTSVVKQSLQPTWDETFTFDDQSLGVWIGQEIKFDIYDWDMLGDSDLLGSVSLDIETISKSQPSYPDGMSEGWFPLRDEDGKIVRGQHDLDLLQAGELYDSELCLRYRYIPAEGRYMEIGIMEARNIPSKLHARGMKSHLPSAFATAAVDGRQYRTEPVKQDANPKWLTTYRFSAKSMSAWVCLQIHELQLARRRSSVVASVGGALKTLEPGEQSLIGEVKVPFYTLFSLSNANLKDIWVELTDSDGMKVRDSMGHTSALRIAVNFVVLGETDATWAAASCDSMRIERNTKLGTDVVTALAKLIQNPSLKHAQAMFEFERLMVAFRGKIPVPGMLEAASTLEVNLSSDVLMLRMLMNTINYDFVVDFAEFCSVLNVLQEHGAKDEIELDMPVLGKSTERSSCSIFPKIPVEDHQRPEKIVDKDEGYKPATFLRVELCQDACQRFPALLEESGGGTGTILSVNEGKLFNKCSVMWDATGVKKEYTTGFGGDNFLAVFQIPSSESLDAQEKMMQDVVIQKHVPARVGMRVKARKFALALYPDLAKQSRGRLGTISWIEPEKKGFKHGSTVEVIWDGSQKRRVVKTGLHDQYHLALYEAPSIIKIEDIEALRTDHAQSFLQELILDGNKIGDPGATALAECLKGNWMLKKLSIKNNRICHAGGIMLGEGLEENTVLEELYLNVNVLGDDGIVQICRALGKMTCALRVLDLEGNQLSYVASRLLAHMLAEAKSLQTLLLKNNMLGGDGADLLQQGLRHAPTLTYLNLERNVLGDTGMRCIMRALRRIPAMRGKKAQNGNKILQKINVSTNNISDECIPDIEESLTKNLTLTTIIADNNVISESGIKKIERLLSENKRRAMLVKSATKVQCLFRGRRERLARAKADGKPIEKRIVLAPQEGDQVLVDNLPGNLKRYNGMKGVIESILFDSEHRQWINVRLEESIRVLPIRCPKKCVTVLVRSGSDEFKQPEQPEDGQEPAHLDIESEATSATFAESMLELAHAPGDAGRGTNNMPDELSAVPLLNEKPRSDGSGDSKMSGISELARERGTLLCTLPVSRAEDLVLSVLSDESPVAPAILLRLAQQELPTSPVETPQALQDSSHLLPTESPEQVRPKTFGGKSIQEHDLMMTAAKLTLVNMGGALIQQQTAAEQMAREAGRKCIEAAEHYAELETYLKAVIVDENTSEDDVKIALQALTDAEVAAVRMMQEADEAEEAVRRAFIAMSEFEQFEEEEYALEKAISGLHGVQEDDQPTYRGSLSAIFEDGLGKSRSTSAGSTASHMISASLSGTENVPETRTIRNDAAEIALEVTACAGASVAADYKRLRNILEDSEANAESIEVAVAEFNRTQDAALVAFDSAIKSLEAETLSLQVYQEDSQIFVETIRQEMADSFERLKHVQDTDGDEEDFVHALADFSSKNAQIAQLVVRAEVFRLGSSWSQSSSRRDSPGRKEAVDLETKTRLKIMRDNAFTVNAKCLLESQDLDSEQYYTSKEEAAALLVQSLMRGAKVRWQRTKPNKQKIVVDVSNLFNKKYSDDEIEAIIKIQGLTRGGIDRKKLRRNKRLGRIAVQQDYLNFLKSQSSENMDNLSSHAVKIQKRFRGGQVREMMQNKSKSAISDNANEILSHFIGTDLMGEDATARFNRNQFAMNLAFGNSARALELEMHQKELAAVIIQKRARGMQARNRTSRNCMSKGLDSLNFSGKMLKSIGMEQQAAVVIQKRVRGIQTRQGKHGLLSGIRSLGNSLSHAFISSPQSPIAETESNYIKMLHDKKKSTGFHNHNQFQQGNKRDLLQPISDEATDPSAQLTEQEIIENQARKDAIVVLGDIRQRAMAELEEDLADEAHLFTNLVYDDEVLDSLDTPKPKTSMGVSFPTLKEFKTMQVSQLKLVETQQSEGKTIMRLQICGHSLMNLDGPMGYSDPYLKFLRINGDGTLHEVGRSSVIRNDLNPRWPSMDVNQIELCSGSRNITFRIECWDSDQSIIDPMQVIQDDLIGWIDTNIERLCQNQPILLNHPSAEYLQHALYKTLLSQGYDAAAAATQAAAASATTAMDSIHIADTMKEIGGAAQKGVSLGISAVSKVGHSGAGTMLKVGNEALTRFETLGSNAISKVGNLGNDAFSKVGNIGSGAVTKVGTLGSGATSKVSNLGNDAISKVGNIGSGAITKVGTLGLGAMSKVGNLGNDTISIVGSLGGHMSAKAISNVSKLTGLLGRPADDKDHGRGFLTVESIEFLSSVDTDSWLPVSHGAVAEQSSVRSSRQLEVSTPQSMNSQKFLSSGVQIVSEVSVEPEISTKEEMARYFKQNTDGATSPTGRSRPGAEAVHKKRIQAKEQSPISNVRHGSLDVFRRHTEHGDQLIAENEEIHFQSEHGALSDELQHVPQIISVANNEKNLSSVKS